MRVGLWGIHRTGVRTSTELQAAVVNALHQAGRRKWTNLRKTLSEIPEQQVYVVLFESIRPKVAEAIHERVTKAVSNDYIGFTEILPEGYHLPLFSILPIRYKLRKGKIAIVENSVGDGTFWFDEITNWAKDRYQELKDSIEAFAAGPRFTILDKYDSQPLKDIRIRQAINGISDEWQVVAEQVVQAMLDTVPDAVDELISAFEIIAQGSLTAAEAASVAVNIRRIFEKLGGYFVPGTDDLRPREKLEKYVQERFPTTRPYQDYLKHEIRETAERIDKLYGLTNKGVHEDWMAQATRIVALRSILTFHELLLPVKVTKPNVYLEEGIFEVDDD